VLSRRRFLQLAGGATASAAAVGLYAWRIEPHWLEIVRRRLAIRRLPARLSGRTLAQLSDIHVGPDVDDDYVTATFRRVAALTPDIVVFTGDLITHWSGSMEQMRRVYRQLPRGRMATIVSLGNHDYGYRWSQKEVAQSVATVVTECGATVLRNEIRDVDGLQIAGLDDFWGPSFAPRPVIAAIESTRAALVLSHNPDTVDLPVWDSYDSWILAGHTHGGQCKPPFLPPPMLPVRNTRYTSGEFDLTGNRQLYISRGVGHLRRVRFNVRPEVTLFELDSA
jgi:uncharacterized protein